MLVPSVSSSSAMSKPLSWGSVKRIQLLPLSRSNVFTEGQARASFSLAHSTATRVNFLMKNGVRWIANFGIFMFLYYYDLGICVLFGAKIYRKWLDRHPFDHGNRLECLLHHRLHPTDIHVALRVDLDPFIHHQSVIYPFVCYFFTRTWIDSSMAPYQHLAQAVWRRVNRSSWIISQHDCHSWTFNSFTNSKMLHPHFNAQDQSKEQSKLSFDLHLTFIWFNLRVTRAIK